MAHTDEANAVQVGRGRDAEAPTDIPLPGWKDVLWRLYLYLAIAEGRILLTGADCQILESPPDNRGARLISAV
jgi:membrane protein